VRLTVKDAQTQTFQPTPAKQRQQTTADAKQTRWNKNSEMAAPVTG